MKLTIVQLLEEYHRLAPADESPQTDDKKVIATRIVELRELERSRRSARTIKAAAYEWLLKVDYLDHAQRSVGFGYDRILEELSKEFPDSETTDKCLRWYAVQLNLDGAKMPWRPRRAPKRRPK